MSTTTSSPHRLEVLKYLKRIQSRHGIAEEQYIRYRQYCTRRLNRVRTASDVKMGIKGGKKYVAQKITPEQIATPKHLTIPLLLAERAWAFANEDQLNLEQPLEDNNGQSDAYLRRHVILSFRKAVKHAVEFETLCSEAADEYTQLQAHFYVQWMQGVDAIHHSNLESALKSFTTAQSILTGLDTINDVELSAICAERLQTIGQFINFCNTRLKRAGADLTTLNLSLATHDPILLAKINNARQQALDQEENKKKGAGGSSDAFDDDMVHFGITQFKILNPKVKHWLIEARSLYATYTAEGNDVGAGATGTENSIDGDEIGFGGKYNILSTIQNAYDNAVIQLHQDLKQAETAHSRAQTSATEDTMRNVNGVLVFIQCLKFEIVFMRHYLQLTDLIQKYDTKNAIAIKTIHAMVDRLGHIITQGQDLYNNNKHYFTPEIKFDTTLAFSSAAFITIQRFYSIQYYLSVISAQSKAFETNTPVVLPKDFVIDPFTTIPTLPQRTKVLLAMIKTNTQQINDVISKVPTGTMEEGKIGQFSMINQLAKGQQWCQLFTTKLSQLEKTSSQLKVVYYSTSQSTQQSSSASSSSATAQDNGVIPALMERLDKYQLGPVSNQYNVINLVPKTQPIPAKPFVFDTAHGLIVDNSEYNTIPQQKAQQEAQQQAQQAQQSQAQEEQVEEVQAAAEDAPKSFWSRLWG